VLSVCWSSPSTKDSVNSTCSQCAEPPLQQKCTKPEVFTNGEDPVFTSAQRKYSFISPLPCATVHFEKARPRLTQVLCSTGRLLDDDLHAAPRRLQQPMTPAPFIQARFVHHLTSVSSSCFFCFSYFVFGTHLRAGAPAVRGSSSRCLYATSRPTRWIRIASTPGSASATGRDPTPS
jgi:hypothetical protein